MQFPHMPGFIYLHGFASGPRSTKACYFAERCSEKGYPLLIPDLNEPDFEKMTLSSQMRIIETAFAGFQSSLPHESEKNSGAILVGSSLGGLLAVLSSRSLRSVRALILMAPAFEIESLGGRIFGNESVERWIEEGYIDIYHYAYARSVRLGYSFLEDLHSYKTGGIKIAVPVLLFHGRYDETIPLDKSLRFAESNKELVELHVLDDDHQLLKSLPEIWKRTESFIEKLGTF